MIPPENPRTSAAKTQSSGPMADLSHPPGRITPEALLFENRARDGCPLRTDGSRRFRGIPQSRSTASAMRPFCQATW